MAPQGPLATPTPPRSRAAWALLTSLGSKVPWPPRISCLYPCPGCDSWPEPSQLQPWICYPRALQCSPALPAPACACCPSLPRALTTACASCGFSLGISPSTQSQKLCECARNSISAIKAIKQRGSWCCAGTWQRRDGWVLWILSLQ